MAQRATSTALANSASMPSPAALSAAYGAGLRVSEVVALKVSDDSERVLNGTQVVKFQRSVPVTAEMRADASVCLSRNRKRRATFCSCQHREIVMRSIFLVLAILLTETSLSFAQGHMGTPQEQQACRRDAQRFCRQQLGDDGAVQQCLQQNRTRLSKSCQKVFASHGM
jgi:hypothetical protein